MKLKNRRTSKNVDDRRDEARASEATRAERNIHDMFTNYDNLQKTNRDIKNYKPKSAIEKKSADDLEHARYVDSGIIQEKARAKYDEAKKKYDAHRLDAKTRRKPKG